MRGWNQLLILLLAVSACAGQPVSQTAADAVELGFEAVRCPDWGGTPVYINSVDRTAACAALKRAIHEVVESDLLASQALVPDSVAVMVVTSLRFGRLPSRPTFPDSGLAVTIDLVSRQDNLIVVWPGVESPVEVSWVPEGLKY
jgi:hypothetical protein